MNDIHSLLNIDAGYIDDFHLLAKAVVDNQMEKLVVSNCKRLQLVAERMMTDYEPVADKRSVEAVIMKVKECVADQTLHSSTWSAHELRMVSYYIMYFEDDENAFRAAIGLLDKYWKDLFFNGLVFYLLNSWNLLRESYRKAVCDLVTNKLSQYRGKNKKYLLLKNHANYFEEKGPSRMARLIGIRDMDVLSAPTLLGFKPSTITMSYYSDVIVKYVDKKSEISIEDVEEILSNHNLDRTKKLVLSDMVLRADCSEDVMLQTQVSKLSQRLLGDITIAATWAPFPGATDDQINTLKLAKELVNKWFARKVIDVFFDVCVQDEDRKQFWLKYTDKITHFMIAGSTSVRHELQTDSRVGELFDNLFIDTNSRYSYTAALIMYIKDRVIVEFSDYGSLYVYKRDNSTIAFLKKGVKQIRSVNDLKSPYCGKLVNEAWRRGLYYLYDEGSMRHAGYWQDRLKLWFKDKLDKETPIVGNEESENTVFSPVNLPQRSSRLTFKEKAFVEPEESSIEDCKHYKKYAVSDISSKELFNNRCRVIANSQGFYISLNSESKSHAHRYFHISPLINFTSGTVTGSIWIKRPDQEQWRAIIHSFSGNEVLIGYIKEDNRFFLFKPSNGMAIIRIKYD